MATVPTDRARMSGIRFILFWIRWALLSMRGRNNTIPCPSWMAWIHCAFSWMSTT